MSNAFSKEEKVAFDNVIEGFQDALVMSKLVNVYNTDQQSMERTNNVIWRPMPYIAQSFSGTDMTGNFKSATQLSVPATIGYPKSAPMSLNALEMRDALQEGRLGESAKQKLASDINVVVNTIAANQGTLFVKRAAAATGFDDVALCEAIMNEQGIPSYDRYLALSTRDYNGMAGNLASRTLDNSKSLTAYDRAFVGRVASFDTFKLDYGMSKTAAAGGAGLTISTLVGAGNYYTPVATSTGVNGETSNVDNRYQTITISSTTSVAAGDAFTIADIYACHHITKGSTNQLKTFRVISVPSSTTLVISPPIISNQGGTDAEAQYQNCIASATASNAAIVFLNTVTGSMNPFWQKDSLELLPGRYVVPANAGVGIMRATTDQGVEVTMTKQYDIFTMTTFIRYDVLFGVVNKQPEMSGIMMFSQT